MHTHRPSTSSLLHLLLATSLSSLTTTASATAVRRQSGPVFLGRPCTPGSSNACVGGAQCYAVNSNLVPTCGNLGASCTDNTQCATNTCVQGTCDGPVAAVLPLGSQCYESQQCVDGAGCYAVNAMEIPMCGSFQAECTSNAQCATNACLDGFCNGPLLSSSSSSSVVVESSTVAPTTSLPPTSVSASTSASASVSSAPVTSPTSTPSSSASASASPSSGQSAPTSAPTSASTTTITTFTTTTSCPSMSTIIPLSTGTGQSSATGNSTIPTTALPSPTIFQGAGEQLRAGCGAIVVAAALGFALMIGA